MPARRILPAFLLALLGTAGAIEAAPQSNASNASLAWLRGQIVPNRVMPMPHPALSGMILSYAPLDTAAGPGHRTSYVYDGALAAIALASTSDWDAAARILSALARVQREDGTFWFSYAIGAARPEAGHATGIVRSGANAWVGQALTFYLERRPAGDARVEEERALLLGAARKVADALLEWRIDGPSASRGLVQGGRASVRLTTGPRTAGVREVHENRPVEWVSTEHNVVSWFFLTGLYGLTGERRYAAAANAIRDRLLDLLWQEDLGQFAQGITADGQVDRRQALDCASWGTLFLLAVGERDRAIRAAHAADSLYRSADRGIRGHRPYLDRPVYDDPAVQRRLLPAEPTARWETFPLVWSEGSLGVALALARVGQAGRARAIVDEVLKLRAKGGIRYASRELPYEFSRDPSVAGTAWHVIVEAALLEPAERAFWWRP